MRSRLVIGNRNYSSWSLRAWWTARRSGLSFDEVDLKLDTPEFARQIDQYSPSGRVPALHDDGNVIWDSLAIAEYLAEKFPDAQLWPGEIADRALARSLCAEMHSGFQAMRDQLPMNCRARNRVVDLGADAQRDVSRVLGFWNQCRRDAGKGRWLFGRWSIADAFYAPVAMRFVTYGVVVPSPAREWTQAVIDDRDIREWRDKAALEANIIEADEVGVIVERGA